MNKQVKQLQERFADLADPGVDPEFCARLSVLEVGELLYLDFWGSPFGEPYQKLCKALIQPDVATVLSLLSLRSPVDEGANGTRNWDLTPLVEHNAMFPSLRSFKIEQNGPGDHNRVIVAETYDEAGVLGQLLHKAPILEVLVSPSAPSALFFTRDHCHLRYLNVDAGYDTQSFISNLAKSSCFPGLRNFGFGEFNETYMDEFQSECTPFEDYRELLVSHQFANVNSFVWRNPVCSEEQITELQSLRPRDELQIQVVYFSSRYL